MVTFDSTANGNIVEYTKVHPDADLPSLVGYPPLRWTVPLLPCQLSNVSEGLEYLHSHNIIHGGIKGASESRKIVLPTC